MTFNLNLFNTEAFIMKKLHGFVDPISLTFLLVLGIASVGTVVEHKDSDHQTMAQDTQTELNESAEAAHQYLAGR
jgi:hypothetical protein